MQESCIFDNVTLQQIQLKCYNLVQQGKSQCGSKGEVTIYLHEQFDYEYKYKLNKYKTWEGQVRKVKKRDYITMSIIIANIYRPRNDSYNGIISELSRVLKSLQTKNEVIISFDVNIYLLKQVISDYFYILINHYPV